jgi:membrane-bound ClpP family serine protease
MSEDALRYLFILALILILVAYFAGSTALFGTIGQQIGSLGLIFTGRNTQGQFAAYPKQS